MCQHTRSRSIPFSKRFRFPTKKSGKRGNCSDQQCKCVGIRRSLPVENYLVLGYGALVEPPSELAAAAVFPGSPAEQAGLRSGDIITHVDTIRVDGDNPLDEILTQYRPRESVTLRVLRGAELLDLDLTLGDRPASN